MTASFNAIADDALGRSDMTDLLDRLARREVSPGELHAAAVSRARTANPHVNAITKWLGPAQGPLGWADEGPLAGIPTVIKDNEDIEGEFTTHGSRAVPQARARRTSPIVAQMLRMGLGALATTTLPEFGLTATTESSRFGATRNPWSLDRSTGGSSGGSAALVAAGVVPIAHANDGGGSTRIPASACGLVGLKPSRGRLLDPPQLQRLPVPMVTQGALTRSVRDTALFYAVSEDFHRDPLLPRIGHVTRPGSRRLRIGLLTSVGNDLPTSLEVRDAVEGAAELCESLGHDIVPAGSPVDDRFGPDFLRYWALLAFLLYRGGPALFGRQFDPGQTERITRGLSSMLTRHGDRVPLGIRRLRRLARDHEAGFADYDVLLSPVTGHSAPPIGHLGPDVPFRTHVLRLLQYANLTPVQNVSGSPAISLPLARTRAGLPLGVQFAAPFGQERLLLELALELEEAAPWPTEPQHSDAAASAPGSGVPVGAQSWI